jgi:DNA-binding LytR/AlgR family response regulator
MDGIEFIGKMLGRDHTIPIIIHTAYPQYKDNFMTWTTEHYILKGTSTDYLLKKIAEVLAETLKYSRRNEQAKSG